MNLTACRFGAAITSASSNWPRMWPSISTCPGCTNEDVLVEAIREGVARLTWHSETFAYADGWDEQKKRYKGLRGGQSIRVLVDAASLVVKPEVAEAQIEAEKKNPSRRRQRWQRRWRRRRCHQSFRGRETRERPIGSNGGGVIVETPAILPVPRLGET